MTDGALPALCVALSRLSGDTIELQDIAHNVIVPASGTPPWEIKPQQAAEPGTDATVIPITAGEHTLGFFEIRPGCATTQPGLDETVAKLASAVREICENQTELRHAVDEITVLFRLSSMLAEADDVASILQIGLESTLSVLGLDAGAIALFPEQDDGRLSDDEKDLRFAASINLSDLWLDSPIPLSKDREFDRRALAGEVVVVEDLATDPRVQIIKDLTREHLVSTIHAGMVFQDRPIGIVRAYANTRRVFNASDMRLVQSIAQQLAVAVEQARLLDVQREEQRIQRQLKLAASVQRRMLPEERPDVEPFDIAAAWTPSVELSGDFYDFVLGDDQLGLVVGDVVGKGVPAALLMSAVRASLRAHADEGYEVQHVLDRVNRDLCRDTRPEEFATIWYAKADPKTLTLAFACAGHDPPILAKPQPDGRTLISQITGGGLIAGVDPAHRYEALSLALKPGEVLVMYTDGVTDALDFDGNRFGRPRLMAAIESAMNEQPGCAAADVLDRIFRDLRSYTGLAPRTDDRTVIVLRVKDNAG
jgi:phosphoserine phosphatase RsbU/P